MQGTQIGDVLLSRPAHWLGRLMAWNAECPYSHAALVVCRRSVVEAVPWRVRRAGLAEGRSRWSADERVDVYRPVHRNGRSLEHEERLALASLAKGWVGRPFAMGRMPALAINTLAANKLAITARLPLPREGAALSCTELVYRALRTVCEVRSAGDARRGGADPRAIITTDLCSSPSLQFVGALRRARSGTAGALARRRPPRSVSRASASARRSAPPRQRPPRSPAPTGATA